MRDFLPADVRRRNYVIGIIKEVYESYGFEPLETPSVENLETLMGKYGEEGNQLIYRVLARGGKLDTFFQNLRNSWMHARADVPMQNLAREIPLSDLANLALRYDLTVPLSRVVANRKNDLPRFFKRYQIQPVWRADRPARGRFREFYQCDVDCIGSESMVVEAEIISAACDILKKLGFSDFLVRVNHRELLRSMVSNAGIDNEPDALVALDKLDKIGADGVKEELLERGISAASADKFLTAVTGDSSNNDLDALLGLCKDFPIKIDPSLARGLSYYTGSIMEIVLTDGDFKGSIGGGGRYDGLIGMFGKEQIPACGFSLGLERILVVMEERGMFPPEIAESTPADVLVTIWNEESVADSLRLADELRQSGLRVTLYPEADKLGKQFKYADSIGVPFVCVIGDDERAAGVVKLKNMSSGEEFRLTSREIAAKVLQ